MFKAIFEGLASASTSASQSSSIPYSSSGYDSSTGAGSGKKDEDPKKKIDPVGLRGDIYKAMDLAHQWMVGGHSGNVGDGLGYRAILAILTPYLTPFLPSSSFQISLTSEELPVITGLLTNTIFLYSSLDGQAMPGAMALSSWSDRLIDAYQRNPDLDKKRALGGGIVRGLTERSEPSLATREFTAKVQIVGALRNVTTAIYGKGSTEARNADAVLGSKFI